MKFPTQDELRARFTRKWTQFEPDVLPLFIAESDFPTAPVIKEVLLDYTERECFGYSPAPGTVDLGGAVSEFHAKRYGWRPDPKKVFWIGDVVRGLLLGIQYFTRPDSPVVVPLPAYPPFLELPETAGRKRIDVGVSPANGDLKEGEKPRLDLESIERAFADGAGSILLANPYNPLGYVFDEEHLHELVELADKYDARILSDEIHAPLVLDGQHISVAGLSDAAARVTMTITATSKAWNFAGLKCAQIIFSNDEDVKTWNSLPHVAQDGVGTLGIIAAEAAYRDGIPHLEEEIEYLRSTRDWLVEELPKRIPGLITSKPDSTYLLWLDFRNTAIGDIEHPAAWLIQHARVAFNEGVTFGEGGAHQARMNFATSPEILEEAIDRVATAIAKVSDN